jgi:hypothetical protein
MNKWLSSLCLLVLLAAGCAERESQPRAYTDKEKEILRAARKAVAQFDDWADRAEFKIQRRKEQWHVTAWRVEHPEAKGNRRYVPWGRREMIIDDTGKVLSYANDR